jgi:hypothetical protein
VLDEIFRRQFGVISREQALATGLSSSAISRRVSAGHWAAVHRGVYRHTTVAESWEARVLAAVLTTGGVASHRSAARLHGLEPFGRWDPEVTVPVGHRPRPVGVIVHRSTQYDRRDAVLAGGIPATGVDRTILDLGAVLSLVVLEKAAESALRRRLTTWPRLHSVLQLHSRRGRDGCGVLRALLEDRYGDPAVPLSQWGRDVARRFYDANLPPCRVEYRVVDELGRHVLQVDLAFPEYRVAVELDSVAFHLSRRSFERDRRIRNELRRLGWVVVEVTWRQWETASDHVIAQVQGALASRSPTLRARWRR